MDPDCKPSLRKKINRHSKSHIISPILHNAYEEVKPEVFPSRKNLLLPDISNPNTRVIEDYLNALKLKDKRKVFMEMMGFKKKTETNLNSIPFSLEVITPTIALTDLMGEKRYNFLKQTGFLPMYNERKRVEEVNRLKEKKNTLTFANVLQLDSIREYTIKHQVSSTPKLTPLTPIITSKKRTAPQRRSHRLDEIEKILNNCDEFIDIKPSKSIKNIERKSINLVKETFSKTPVSKRISARELTSIQINALRSD